MFVTFIDILLEWNGVQSRIIQSNILANNGIIHIIDRILFKVEEETTTSSDSMNTRGVNAASTRFSAVVSYLLVLSTFCIVYLVKRWYDVSTSFKTFQVRLTWQYYARVLFKSFSWTSGLTRLSSAGIFLEKEWV